MCSRAFVTNVTACSPRLKHKIPRQEDLWQNSNKMKIKTEAILIIPSSLAVKKPINMKKFLADSTFMLNILERFLNLTQFYKSYISRWIPSFKISSFVLLRKNGIIKKPSHPPTASIAPARAQVPFPGEKLTSVLMNWLHRGHVSVTGSFTSWKHGNGSFKNLFLNSMHSRKFNFCVIEGQINWYSSHFFPPSPLFFFQVWSH